MVNKKQKLKILFDMHTKTSSPKKTSKTTVGPSFLLSWKKWSHFEHVFEKSNTALRKIFQKFYSIHTLFSSNFFFVFLSFFKEVFSNFCVPWIIFPFEVLDGLFWNQAFKKLWEWSYSMGLKLLWKNRDLWVWEETKVNKFLKRENSIKIRGGQQTWNGKSRLKVLSRNQKEWKQNFWNSKNRQKKTLKKLREKNVSQSRQFEETSLTWFIFFSGKKEIFSFFEIFFCLCQNRENFYSFDCFFLKLEFEFSMNFEIVLQLASVIFILAAGPLVVVLLSARGGNL